MPTFDPAKHVPFDQLSIAGTTGEHHSWDVFGRSDELGCLNFIDAKAVRNAASLVVEGEVFNLDLELDQPQPQFWAGSRAAASHHEEVRRQGRDDHLDGFYLQGTTQWDGLRHYRYREFGYFGGRDDTALDERGELGIDRMAEHGIITRGVLLDVKDYFESAGTPLDYEQRRTIGAPELQAIADASGITMTPGDIVLLHTGWLEWYESLPIEVREQKAAAFKDDRGSLALPGLDPSQATMSWLWNNQVAAVAADNATLEALPYVPAEGWGHRRMLPLLGLPIGELWNLGPVARRCRELGRSTFLLTSSPLNVPKGTGSPANAYAVL